MSELVEALQGYFEKGGEPLKIVSSRHRQDRVEVTVAAASDGEMTLKCGCGKGDGTIRPGGEWTCLNCGAGVTASHLTDSVVAVE